MLLTERMNGLSNTSPAEVEFYEQVYLFYVRANDFNKAEQKFNSLNYLYTQNQGKSDQQTMIYSLHLLYLISSNREEDYRCLRGGLGANQRAQPQIEQVEQFANLVNMGNYGPALTLASNMSPYHALVTAKMEESKIIENCKLVDLFYEKVTLKDITSFLNIKNQTEMDNMRQYVDRLFDVS